MKLSLFLTIWLSVLCICLMSGEAVEATPPKLEIVSAIYGKGPEAVDITEKVRKKVEAGTYVSFHNHPRFANKYFKDRKADKNIRIEYKLGGKTAKAVFPNNAQVTLGCLLPKFQFGTPEWIHHYIDFSGAGLVLTPLDCLQCEEKGTVEFRPIEEDHLRCRKCGFVFSEKTLPTSGMDMFEGMKLEYHQLSDRRRIYWKPILRTMKAQYAYNVVSRIRSKDPAVARKKLDTMLAYAKFFKKHMVRGVGRHTFRPGYPHHCNWGRLTHFGDYVFPSSFCNIYQSIASTGLQIMPEERAEYRSLLENIISEITLPFIRQWRGMGNPMGQAFADCIACGITFPEARIIDYYTLDADGKKRVMNGTDLVYESMQGRDGLENLIANYWYSDGLMHEPTFPYQGMLVGGVGKTLKALKSFRPPSGYDPVKRGYRPIRDFSFLDSPGYRNPMIRHTCLAFPNGEAIPFGDCTTRMANKTPPKESNLYHGWGIGVLRFPNTVAAMNWGNLRDGHSHNDMLNLLYWGDGMLLLNTTEYPARNDAKIPIDYWRNGAGAHNTVMVDGINHERSRGGAGAWGITDHLQMMQGVSDKTYPGIVLRRSAFLVNSRPGLPPYLVDFYQVDGGKESHDYFLRAQSRYHKPLEKLEIISPKMSPTGKKNLADVLANAEKKNVYPHIRGPKFGKFRGSAELRWTLPYQGSTLCLRGILVPEAIGNSFLYTGSTPGFRTGRQDSLDRRVQGVVWRREKAPSEKEMHSCFLAAFEYAKAGDKMDLEEVKRLNVSGSPASRAAEVTHGSGKDILLLSNGKETMSVNTSAGKIAFNGVAALLTLDRNGKLMKVTTTGTLSLEVNGKNIPVGSLIRGKLAGIPDGLSEWLQNEKNAKVIVWGQVPQEAIGNMLLVKHRTATASYKIIGGKPLPGNRTELELDRSARHMILRVSVAPNRRNMEILSGGGDGILPDSFLIVKGQSYRVQSVDRSKFSRGGVKKLGNAALTVEKPLPESGEQRIPVTEFGPDDPYTVMTSRTVEFSGGASAER